VELECHQENGRIANCKWLPGFDAPKPENFHHLT